MWCDSAQALLSKSLVKKTWVMFARIVSLLSFVVWSAPATAQLHRSVLHAQLLDAHSQPAIGVPVRVISERTGGSRRVVSDEAGRISVPQLEPDAYRIEIEDERYRDFLARVVLRAGEVIDLTLPLAYGSVSAVDARPFLVTIDRHSPALRTFLEHTLLTRIPLESRTFSDAVLLAPATTGGDFGPVGAGVGLTSTTYLLDGFSDMEPLLGTPAVVPPVESLSQIGVVRAAYDAAFGRSAGAQVNVTARSGGNRRTAEAHGLYQTRSDRAWLGGSGGGALAENRTFVFADAEYRPVEDSSPFRHDGHHVGARMDHLLAGGAWLTGRYALTRGTALERRGQHAGVSLTHMPAMRLTNDVRAGFSRVAFGEFADLPGITESNAWQVADTLSWWAGPHVAKAGIEWYGFSRGVDSAELAGHTWSVFVQDDWRAAPALTLTGGVRFEHLSHREAETSDTTIAPRVGFAWAVGEELRTAIRGGYGRYVNDGALHPRQPRVDHWSLGAQRQMGRVRTLEFTYLGSRADEVHSLDRTMRYHAFQVQMQQRSETALSGQFAYTFGRWTTEGMMAGERVRSPYDSRHKATAAFSWPLPIGDERRWLHRGTIGEILRDMELAGVAALQTGRPLSLGSERQQPQYHRLDLALLKYVRTPASTVQLRLDVFNVTNRGNPVGAFFGADPFDWLIPRVTGRRYQLGAKILF